MNLRATTIRRLARLAIGAVGLTWACAAGAQFPITESFRGANPGSWRLVGSAQLTSGTADPIGQGWLRLTGLGQGEAGSAIYDTPFSSTAGIVVSFTYATSGGTGADGFSFYLIDGATNPPTVGANGGSLGYSVQYLAGCGGPFWAPGVTNGYLGVGFDEYGNFSDCEYGSGGPGPTPSGLAIRGSGSGYDPLGFRYLTGTALSAPPWGQDIATGGRTGARPVRLSIINHLITVELDLGAGYQTVIDRFDLSTAPGQAPLPATFKMGLSASTGYFTNYHEFRDLTVSMPVRLQVIHAVAPAVASVGDLVRYDVTVTNDQTNAVSGVAFTDPVPSPITGVTWTAALAGGATASSVAGAGNAISAVLGLPRSSSVTFTITGTVGAALAGATISHAATLTVPPGASNLGDTSAAAMLTVGRMASAVALDASANPSSLGTLVTFQATASAVPPGSGIPSGTVTFMAGANTLASLPLVAGRATFSTSALPPGTTDVEALYDGDGRFLGAVSANLSQQVDPIGTAVTLSATPDLAVLDSQVALVAIVTAAGPTPTGTVTFLDGAATLGSAPLVSGGAVLATSTLPLGDHDIVARFEGSAGFLASTSAPSLVTVTRLQACEVPTDCASGEVCVRTTRNARFGLCQPPTGRVSGSTGCGTSGHGSSGAVVALLFLALVLRGGRQGPARARAGTG